MNNKVILSIAIITMNRADQLNEAIHSCLLCEIPDNTQFVIVDNASSDNTKDVVNRIKSNYPQIVFDYYYSSLNEGVGGGRNKAFEMSKGKYVYFLDDDAVIAPECYSTFFVKSIWLMENCTDVASLSTNIYDTICGNSRNPQGNFKEEELVDILAWKGGSHFLRRAYQRTPLYLKIRYGCEELVPSILIWNKGLRNVYYGEVRIIHQPRVNKWVKDSSKLEELAIIHSSMRYATFRLLYPKAFYPVIYLALIARCQKHLKSVDNSIEKCLKLADEIIKSHHIEKISTRTIFCLWKKFGMTIF